MNTEFGKIAEMVQTAEEEETPLQKKLDKFASKIAKIVVAFVLLFLLLKRSMLLFREFSTLMGLFRRLCLRYLWLYRLFQKDCPP